MVLANKLDRNLRAAEDSSDGEDYYEVTDRSSSASVIDGDEGGNVISSDEDEEAGFEDTSDAHDDDDDDQVKAQMSKVSFGALAKAQESLSKQQPTDRKRKRGDDTSQDDKLEALRERLRQIKAEKLASGAQPSKKAKTSSKSKTKDTKNEGEGKQGASDDEDSDSDAAPHARSSKHAPAVQSSKRMVSRKRNVVEVKKPVFRDPRFSNVSGPMPDEHVVGKRYSFLNDYRASEISELRNTIKKTKNETEKERLKKMLLSMESQQKARENKAALENVTREHKKKEKELVKEGKKPFFLKKSEQKKIALVDRFQNMKSKQRDKVIERRRKKVTAKERKNMPDERRTAQESVSDFEPFHSFYVPSFTTSLILSLAVAASATEEAQCKLVSEVVDGLDTSPSPSALCSSLPQIPTVAVTSIDVSTSTSMSYMETLEILTSTAFLTNTDETMITGTTNLTADAVIVISTM
ncbi:rrna processing protein [Stemphylium lycopersici]|nr:rrna processing protein [Stemphylium lycopersici]